MSIKYQVEGTFIFKTKNWLSVWTGNGDSRCIPTIIFHQMHKDFTMIMSNLL